MPDFSGDAMNDKRPEKPVCVTVAEVTANATTNATINAGKIPPPL
jgi:hypothetical protein